MDLHLWCKLSKFDYRGVCTVQPVTKVCSSKYLNSYLMVIACFLRLQPDWSWPGTGLCQCPVWAMVPSGGFHRFPPSPQSTLRTAPHHADLGPPEHAHTSGGHRLPLRTQEAWKEGNGKKGSYLYISLYLLTSGLYHCSLYAGFIPK